MARPQRFSNLEAPQIGQNMGNNHKSRINSRKKIDTIV